MRNMASSALSSINSVKSGIASITARRPVQSIDELNRKLDELRRARNISIDSSQIRRLNREIDSTERRLSRLDNPRRGGGGGIGLGLSSLVAGAGLTLGLGTMANAGLQAQAQQASFEVVAGEQQGRKLFNDLTKFAQDSIFGEEVKTHAQTLLAFGRDARKVSGDIRMLGDVSMGNKDRMAGLALAFANTQAAGKLMGQDLLQYVNAGFNPLNELSRTTGKSMAQLRDEMSKGLITFGMVEGAFISATSEGGKFHNMTQKIANTDFGKVEAFKGQLSGLAMQFGGVLAPVMGNLITNYLAPFATWIGKHQDLVVGLGAVLIAGVGAYKAITIAQGLLNVVMSANPIGLIVGGIAALAAGFVYAYNKLDWFRGGIAGAWEGLKEFGRVIKDVVIDRIKSLLTGIAGIGGALMQFFKGDWSAAFETGKQAVSDLVGVSTIRKAYDGAKKVGAATQSGYAAGAAEVKKKSSKEAGSADPSSNPLASVAGGGNLASTGSAGGSSAGVTAGGAGKAINITVHKFFDNIIIQGKATFAETTEEIQRITEEAMLRVLHSNGA